MQLEPACWSSGPCLKSDATGHLPFQLMFGREARLPAVCFGTSPDGIEDGCHSRYVAKLKEDLKESFKLASVGGR